MLKSIFIADRAFPHMWVLGSLIHNARPGSPFYEETHSLAKNVKEAVKQQSDDSHMKPALSLSQASLEDIESGWYYTDDEEEGGVKLAQEEQTALGESPYVSRDDSDGTSDVDVNEKVGYTEKDWAEYNRLKLAYSRLGYVALCQDCLDFGHWSFECPEAVGAGKVDQEGS
jgi:hypothetical protein